MDFTFKQLSAPFPYEDIEWRAGATNKEKTKALALAYITSRAVMNRLDDVCGPHNWRDEYAAGPDGGVICGLSIRVGDEWITKWDGAENSNIEAVKGGLSDAFKRAAVKWGIGRYLYGLDGVWVECEAFGNTVKLKGQPKLPAWALPDAAPRTQAPATVKTQADEAAAVMFKGKPLGEATTDALKQLRAGVETKLHAGAKINDDLMVVYTAAGVLITSRETGNG